MPGEKRDLFLELKLLADVGIIGLPNAGKSTLIKAISSASPKIGNYPFTTLTPNLGVVKTDWSEPFIVADIPGLIEGAHQGAGLGTQFLRHIERTRLLIHLIDASAVDANHLQRSYEVIQNELASYNEYLLRKPQIIVLNKLDIDYARKAADGFMKRFKMNEPEILFISALKGQGLKQLKSKIIALLDHTG